MEEECKANSKQNGPEDGRSTIRSKRLKSRAPVSRTYQLPAHEKTPSTTEATESGGLGAGEETGLEEPTQSKHNHLPIFNSIVTSVYTILNAS